MAERLTFSAQTHDVIVRAAPEFLAHESDAEARRFVWAYYIEIENVGAAPVTLLARHWIITDARGLTQEVRGPGVVGQSPRIASGARFAYSSSAALATPSGLMYGAYTMRIDNQREVEVAIPAFPLETQAMPAGRAN
jgi:ApaG protein